MKGVVAMEMVCGYCRDGVRGGAGDVGTLYTA